jgi:hypothetical protein
VITSKSTVLVESITMPLPLGRIDMGSAWYVAAVAKGSAKSDYLSTTVRDMAAADA